MHIHIQPLFLAYCRLEARAEGEKT